MDPFTLGFIMGGICGFALGIIAMVLWDLIEDRISWRRYDEMDGYLERLKAIQRHPLSSTPPDPRYYE